MENESKPETPTTWYGMLSDVFAGCAVTLVVVLFLLLVFSSETINIIRAVEGR